MDVTALVMQVSVVVFMIGSLAAHAGSRLAGPAIARLLLWAIPLDRP